MTFQLVHARRPESTFAPNKIKLPEHTDISVVPACACLCTKLQTSGRFISSNAAKPPGINNWLS
jgi:hypothetical protein